MRVSVLSNPLYSFLKVHVSLANERLRPGTVLQLRSYQCWAEGKGSDILVWGPLATWHHWLMSILVICMTAMWAALLYVSTGLFLADFGILDSSISPTCHEHVEFSPPFITVLPHLVSSANVINIICIPASWSSSRYSVSRNIQIFFIRTGSRTDLCKTPLDISFRCENESLITTL